MRKGGKGKIVVRIMCGRARKDEENEREKERRRKLKRQINEGVLQSGRIKIVKEREIKRSRERSCERVYIIDHRAAA